MGVKGFCIFYLLQQFIWTPSNLGQLYKIENVLWCVKGTFGILTCFITWGRAGKLFMRSLWFMSLEFFSFPQHFIFCCYFRQSHLIFKYLSLSLIGQRKESSILCCHSNENLEKPCNFNGETELQVNYFMSSLNCLHPYSWSVKIWDYPWHHF